MNTGVPPVSHPAAPYSSWAPGSILRHELEPGRVETIPGLSLLLGVGSPQSWEGAHPPQQHSTMMASLCPSFIAGLEVLSSSS